MTSVGKCFLCGNAYGPGHDRSARHIDTWKVVVCEKCELYNWDGLVPRSHPRLLMHLKANGIEVVENEKGWIDIPPDRPPN